MAARATAFGISAEEIDGQDVRLVYAAAQRMVARARAGDGPSFLLANTYRYHGHHVGDIARTYYRSKEEEAHWRTQRDPITILGEQLIAEGAATPEQLDALRAQAKAEVEAGAEFGLNAPFPDVSEVSQDVYA